MLTFDKAVFVYPDKTKIGPFHLSVKKGEVHLLCGPSGSGKTSITKLANGIIAHFFEGEKQGLVLLDGKNIAELTVRELICRVASVYQNPKTQFFTDNSTSELLLPAENLGCELAELEARLKQVSEFFGLAPLLDRNVLTLSGGEKQTLCLAGTLMTDPDVIVLDEPTGNLDMAGISRVRAMISKLKSLNKSILISEHRLSYLNGLVDQVSVIGDGKIVQAFSGEAFYRLPVAERRALGLRCLRQPEEYKAPQVTDSPNQLEIKSLGHPLKPNMALRIHDLCLKGGRVCFLVGKNGAGKTSLARCLTGLSKARQAEIYLNGQKMKPKDRLKHSYLVFQNVNTQLFTASVKEEIELNNSFGQTADLLSRLGMADKSDTHPQALSGGQKQRVALAAGIASGKTILIADEPTSGMDYLNMKNVSELLRDYARQGNIVLVISHDLELINELADEVLFMEQGRIVRQVSKGPETVREVAEFLM